MNGAEKIVNAMKQVQKSNKQIPSEICSVSVVSINPLIFQLENRIQITNEFYELSNLYDWTKATVGKIFRAMSFNEGQRYYILEPYPLQSSTNSSNMDDRISTNRTDINELIQTVSAISTTIETISQQIVILNKNEPIGTGHDYFGTTEPENYMWADGRAISRTTYSELFEIIGTTYGAGDGSTTFNIPDKRERVSIMYKENSTNGTTDATLGTLGAKGGEFKHTQTVSEMAEHNHDNILVTGGILSLNSEGSDAFKIETASSSANSQVNALYTSSNGSSTPFNVMQPYFVCNYIIKVK